MAKNPQRIVAVAGRRYRVAASSYDDLLRVSGYGLTLVPLPAGVTFDSPDLREQVAAAAERWNENRRKAGEWLQERVRAGRAGLTNDPDTEEP
jgi:hypothetical protein